MLLGGVLAERILVIPLGVTELQDELFWRFTKDGIYSTHSGYLDGTGLELENDGGGGGSGFLGVWQPFQLGGGKLSLLFSCGIYDSPATSLSLSMSLLRPHRFGIAHRS
ncbi:hypothetical protein ACS0TY_008386 [Phlomoides rotata]